MVRHGQIWFSENGHIIATFLWKLSEKIQKFKKPSEHFPAYNLSKNLIFLKIKIDHVSWSDHGQLWWSDAEPDNGQTMVNHFDTNSIINWKFSEWNLSSESFYGVHSGTFYRIEIKLVVYELL